MENNSSHMPSRKHIANWNKHREGLHECSGAWRGLRRLGEPGLLCLEQGFPLNLEKNCLTVSPRANSAVCLPQYIILMLITYAFEMASCITAATHRDFVSISFLMYSCNRAGKCCSSRAHSCPTQCSKWPVWWYSVHSKDYCWVRIRPHKEGLHCCYSNQRNNFVLFNTVLLFLTFLNVYNLVAEGRMVWVSWITNSVFSLSATDWLIYHTCRRNIFSVAPGSVTSEGKIKWVMEVIGREGNYLWRFNSKQHIKCNP